MILFDVKKRLGDFTLEASFSTDGARVVALFGHSGAGKTSIINMVAGLVTPDEGKIVVKDRCVFDSHTGVNLPPERRRFGYVFQDGRLFPHLSVRTNLCYGMKLVPPGGRHVRFEQVVDLLGIAHLLNRRPAKLSGGEKQRVAIGRALLTSPALLLMDEPMSSLDNARKSEVLPFVAQLPREFAIPILYSSHSPDEILSISDKVVIIQDGKVVTIGSPEALLKKHNLTTVS